MTLSTVVVLNNLVISWMCVSGIVHLTFCWAPSSIQPLLICGKIFSRSWNDVPSFSRTNRFVVGDIIVTASGTCAIRV